MKGVNAMSTVRSEPIKDGQPVIVAPRAPRPEYLALALALLFFGGIAWVAGGKLSMGNALVSAHGGAFVIALALLWWRENGNRRGLWRARLAARAGAAT